MFSIVIFTRLAGDLFRTTERIGCFIDPVCLLISVEIMSADISSLRNMDSHIVKKQCELLRTEKMLSDV
jgi:hypothetical protein